MYFFFWKHDLLTEQHCLCGFRIVGSGAAEVGHCWTMWTLTLDNGVINYKINRGTKQWLQTVVTT